MAWDTQARTSYAADQAGTNTLTTFLVTRQRYLFQIPFEVSITPEQSTTSASYVELASIQVYIPEYAGTYKLNFRPEVKVDAGTGAWKLRDEASATDGTEVTGITNTGYQDSSASQLTIAAGWADSEREITVYGKNTPGGTGNAFYVLNVDRLTMWFSET